MKLKIKQYGFDFKEKQIGNIIIDQKYTDLWYKEIMRRFGILSGLKGEDTKQRYLKDFPCFDIDETYECGEIGLPHLIELLTFIKKEHE